MLTALILYDAFMAAAAALMARRAWRGAKAEAHGAPRALRSFAAAGLGWGLAALAPVLPLTIALGGSMFTVMRFGAHFAFHGLPAALVLFGALWLLLRRSRTGAAPALSPPGAAENGNTRTARRLPAWPAWLALLAAALAVAAWIEAFQLCPRRLRVRRYEVRSARLRGLERPIRIALVADLQTDRVGPYERRALLAAVEARPDMILFAGDYIQTETRKDYEIQCARLRALLGELNVRAPLGCYAVGGNIDRDDWFERIFDGTGVQNAERRSVAAGGDGKARLTVEGLDLDASLGEVTETARRTRPRTDPDTFVIALGHGPDFAAALGAAGAADLCLAGHTHGGQVCLPGIGPLVTFSALPRAAAAGGVHRLGSALLIVSRGIGMERGDAPRLRLFCPPEVVLVDLLGPAAPP